MDKKDRKRPAGCDAGDPEEIEILEIEGMSERAEAEEPEETEVVFDEQAPAAAPAGGADVREDPASRERLLRLQADFDNLRKRVEREQADLRKAAAGRVVSALLPVLDNFERAVSSERVEGDDEAFREGVELIHRQFLDVLRREGLRPVEAVGRPFDPSVHEAVATDPATGLPPDTVVAEIQRGYFLHGRLLRPALVTVSVAAGADAVDAGREEGR